MKICAHKNNSSFCKECKKEYDRMNYINNRDEFLKRQKKYYEDNKEYILEYQKNYVKENEEKIASRRKKHYEDNKIVYSDRTKKQREKNRLNNIINGTILDKKICYICKNDVMSSSFRRNVTKRDGLSDECNSCRNDYERRRKIIDPSYKLKCMVHSVIWNMIRKNNGSKGSNLTWDKLPYSPRELREHLESQFDENMSWDNYGSYWHIDHIYPQSLLIYDSLEHPNFLKCWSLRNLRPLEAKENLRKGNKVLNG